jgi:hypothetical protein
MAITPDGSEAHAGRIADVVEVHNQEGKFGSADTYYAIRLQLENGEEKTALFTEHELKTAVERAEKNPEDVPTVSKLRNFFD